MVNAKVVMRVCGHSTDLLLLLPARFDLIGTLSRIFQHLIEQLIDGRSTRFAASARVQLGDGGRFQAIHGHSDLNVGVPQLLRKS